VRPSKLVLIRAALGSFSLLACSGTDGHTGSHPCIGECASHDGGAGGSGGSRDVDAGIPIIEKHDAGSPFGPLNGLWVFQWGGHDDCTNTDFDGLGNMGINQMASALVVTIDGTSVNGTWDGSTLTFDAPFAVNGATEQVHFSFSIDGDTITAGTGTWTDEAKHCGGKETYIGNQRRNTYP
jgi:hypothetical protein